MGLQKPITLWPTPVSSDYKHRGPGSKQQGLADAVRHLIPEISGLPSGGGDTGTKKELFLTPRAGDTGKGEKKETFIKRTGDKTDACFQSLPAQAGGQLSADWVEALMGYPPGWTDIGREAGFENFYPEKWLDGTWEEGIPRTAVKQAHRVPRLKCLGNAVVPQCCALIFLSPVFDPWRDKRADL
jgi:hypothetical protein